jgi:hypothetical protein
MILLKRLLSKYIRPCEFFRRWRRVGDGREVEGRCCVCCGGGWKGEENLCAGLEIGRGWEGEDEAYEKLEVVWEV